MQVEVQRASARQGSRANVEATRRTALDLFVRHGFDGTSMREIARQVGVSAATIYNYTDCKESLLWDVVRQVREDLDQARAKAQLSSACPPEILRESLTTMARYQVEHSRECHVLASSAGSLSVEHARLLTRSLRGELAFFESLIDAAWRGTKVGQGELRIAAMMLVEATKLGARVATGGSLLDDLDAVPARVARFGLRSVGVSAADHSASCADPDRCGVARMFDT